MEGNQALWALPLIVPLQRIGMEESERSLFPGAKSASGSLVSGNCKNMTVVCKMIAVTGHRSEPGNCEKTSLPFLHLGGFS